MKRRLLGLTATGMLVAATFAVAQTPAQHEAVTRDDVRALTGSVERLVGVVERAIVQRERTERLDLAISYLQFRSRRIEGLEKELRTEIDRRASTDEALQSQRQRLDEIQQRLADEPDHNTERAMRMVDALSAAIATQEERLDRLDRTILDLENEIAQSSRELQAFEDYVLENLDLEE